MFGIQTIPGILALSTLIQASLIKGAVALTKEATGDDTAASVIGGVTLGLTALGTWLGVGLPLARCLAQRRRLDVVVPHDAGASLSGALASAGGAGEPSGLAALFDDSTLWHDPANAAPRARRPPLPDRRPSARQGVAALRRADLEISQDGHVVSIRDGATVTPVQIGPGKRSVEELHAALTAVAGVQARIIDPVDTYDLPWPSTVADPADDRDPRLPATAPERTAFAPLPTSEADAVVVRHAPDAELTTLFGLAGPTASRFQGVRIVPQATLGDIEDTALGAAADLAVLLALAVASRLSVVFPATPDPNLVPGAPAVVGALAPIDRVFRDWNLDDRRVNEWRMIVAGGAATEDAPPPAARPRRGRAGRARARVAPAVANLAADGERPDAGRGLRARRVVRTDGGDRRRRELPADQRAAERRHPLPPQPARLSAMGVEEPET